MSARHAHRLGWPMLSAIVVDKAENVATGTMEPETH